MKNYLIECMHNIYVDNYEQGEGDNVNNFDTKGEYKAESPTEAMSSGAIHDYAPNMVKWNFIRFCEPRMKNSYKRLCDAIKQVAKIKTIGWNTSDFIVVNSNGNCVIGFDTESFRNSIDFKPEIILWQSK